jgi:DNA-binding response OmpR family regulator
MVTSGYTRKKETCGKVLLIEGDYPLEEEFIVSLADSGLSIARISGCSQTILALNNLSPDIAIIDETLLDGLKMCLQLHIMFSIPVLLIGRDSTRQILEKAVIEADNFDFYIKRPFSCQLFAARIKDILQHHQSL